MFKQCLHMKNLFFQINNIYWCKQSRKHDRKPYYPYGFRNLFKTINQ